MPKLFDLRSFRILALGGAKASTNGQDDLPDAEASIKFFVQG
jgi:hypothetical protein